MRKICITFLIVAIIFVSVIGLFISQNSVTTEYLRIHIRADSNLDADQNVKYMVKDAVIGYLAPYITQCDSKEKALKMLNDNLNEIEITANKVLKDNGFNYTSRAKVKSEKFPTRFYNDLCLEGGYYDALILELGSGEGDNWWCVVYPPLCFIQKNVKYEYRSKIKDLIDEFFLKKEI